MNGLLVRVGIDHSYGNWNAPADPYTKEFVYVPIPEGELKSTKLETTYKSHLPELELFCNARNLDLTRDLGFPSKLHTLATHHDPDFKNMTYGDVDGPRSRLTKTIMKSGDIIVFYAGLKPTKSCEHKLLYAIIGLYVIDEVVSAGNISQDRWGENAHTRRQHINASDVIIRAKRGEYGLLDRCIVIGEYRDKAYRVTNELLEAWGGLSVKDGYIQRSAVPPSFLDAEKFFLWFQTVISSNI